MPTMDSVMTKVSLLSLSDIYKSIGEIQTDLLIVISDSRVSEF